jgi:hypothetical protein
MVSSLDTKHRANRWDQDSKDFRIGRINALMQDQDLKMNKIEWINAGVQEPFDHRYTPNKKRAPVREPVI